MILRLLAAAVLAVSLPLATFLTYLAGTEFSERVVYGFDTVPPGTPERIEIAGNDRSPSSVCQQVGPGEAPLQRPYVFECVNTYSGFRSVLTHHTPFPIVPSDPSFEVEVVQSPLPEAVFESTADALWIYGIVVLSISLLLTRSFEHRDDLKNAGRALARRPAWMLLPLAVALPGSALVAALYPEAQAAYGIQYVAQGFLAVLVMTVLAPIGEELLFRGWMQRYLDAVMPPRLALLATSGLFATSHLPAHPAIGAYFFALGLSFGWIRRRTGSVWFAALAHVVVNGTGVLLAGLD